MLDNREVDILKIAEFTVRNGFHPAFSGFYAKK
jgi:hypothetical protein